LPITPWVLGISLEILKQERIRVFLGCFDPNFEGPFAQNLI
jgi:hypothetical protein